MATNPITASKFILRGGSLLQHDKEDHVHPVIGDVLVEDGVIAAIGTPHIADPDDKSTPVIDCRGKIISPGFINTHHHVWQSPLKGRHSDNTLLQYMPTGNFTSVFFSAEDGFWGELGGCLEALDAGTTTVLDHSHLNNSPDHPKSVVQGLLTSGIRGIYCLIPQQRIVSESPLVIAGDPRAPSYVEDFSGLATAAPLTQADPRVQLGLAIDALYLPKEALQPLFDLARCTPAAQLITAHGVGGPMMSHMPSAIQLLAAADLLGPDVVISHSCGTTPGVEDALLRKHGGFISTTPNTELQMGQPLAALKPEFRGHTSVGIDCHTWGVSYMPDQLRMLLQHERHELESKLLRKGEKGRWSRRVGPTVEEAFNLGTIAGARAVGLGNRIGSIAVGKRADLLVYATDSPGMVIAAEENPLAAVLMHSSERDVEMVIVDGVFRKFGGKLLDVQGAEDVAGNKALPGVAGKTIPWKEVAAKMSEIRRKINERVKDIDFKAAEEAAIDNWHLGRGMMTENRPGY